MSPSNVPDLPDATDGSPPEGVDADGATERAIQVAEGRRLSPAQLAAHIDDLRALPEDDRAELCEEMNRIVLDRLSGALAPNGIRRGGQVAAPPVGSRLNGYRRASRASSPRVRGSRRGGSRGDPDDGESDPDLAPLAAPFRSERWGGCNRRLRDFLAARGEWSR